ncbi:hypothetical protein SAMN04487944_103158 [Gracilibacillus ureilyticus]|uniref:DUF2798 domain-containing protein n=1 Tax=Gracilibacillus ureilyticus TaxID=531814 RepID=A0A1H9NI86_9BACI|nr:DUF2798 domain-containing protein [Gracilibacillus ureilyticus]SER35622.1 hypothetical protein SAMN04487944_103158 [Gracilibacillus ureilyticus]
MPTNKKESFLFGLIMCSGMVAVMATYNLLMMGNLEQLTMQNVLVEVFIGFILALLLDLYIVGPIAKKLTLRLPFDKSNKALFVLCMSTSMIIGMVFFMSAFGLIMSFLGQGMDGRGILSAYGIIFMKNFIVAFPLQLLIMGPIVRYIFNRFIQKGKYKMA